MKLTDELTSELDLLPPANGHMDVSPAECVAESDAVPSEVQGVAESDAVPTDGQGVADDSMEALNKHLGAVAVDGTFDSLVDQPDELEAEPCDQVEESIDEVVDERSHVTAEQPDGELLQQSSEPEATEPLPAVDTDVGNPDYDEPCENLPELGTEQLSDARMKEPSAADVTNQDQSAVITHETVSEPENSLVDTESYTEPSLDNAVSSAQATSIVAVRVAAIILISFPPA